MNNKEIGNRIKLARTRQGKSLQDVAETIGVARSTIQRYESGSISKLKLPVIESIAKTLNVRPDWIIGKTNIMIPEPLVASHQDYPNTLKSLLDKANLLNNQGLLKLNEYADDLISSRKYEKTKAKGMVM
ncbi:helix-turn-helix domain-containing protein [Parabacteroides goldsteinii]|uniref:helix-turn-helix domain-containing protein n=1 Tax=Parabacteroides goldsteinii TaxID=328812 RepID=UPI002577FED7|nr:helix-turn-helix transcriptional regulator [Parabacteroides goldsteinii]